MGYKNQIASSLGPSLTVVVAFFNMRREAELTLHTLTPEYQAGVASGEYDVVAVDNGSRDPLREDEVTRFGPNFRYVLEPKASSSPAAAINRAVAECSTPWVMCLIDGARMLTPGIVAGSVAALQAHPDGFVYTVGMHLGPAVQNQLIARGYGQANEDALLASVDWRRNGYRLYEISSFAPSVTGKGFFSPVLESNCFALRRSTFLEAGGFEERFQSAGGGLVNPDVFKRFVEDARMTPICLVGEATFHQLHGGVATNVPPPEHPGASFAAEYESIRGKPYAAPAGPRPVFWGEIPDEARRLGPLEAPGPLAWRLSATAVRLRLAWLALTRKYSPRRLRFKGAG